MALRYWSNGDINSADYHWENITSINTGQAPVQLFRRRRHGLRMNLGRNASTQWKTPLFSTLPKRIRERSSLSPGYRKVLTRWIRHVLIDKMRLTQVTICQSLLLRSHRKKFLETRLLEVRVGCSTILIRIVQYGRRRT